MEKRDPVGIPVVDLKPFSKVISESMPVLQTSIMKV